MTSSAKLLHQQLKENLLLLEQSQEALEYSYRKCKGLDPTQFKTPEELESWEALTSRFARTSDIFTQKVCKTLFLYLQENILTFLDGAHFLEKISIVKKADDIMKIRELRNEISHEYADPEHIYAIFSQTLNAVPQLKEIIERAEQYIQNLR